MYFRTVASVVVLACASHVAAEPQPYKIAMMPVPGLSLLRRDTSGYQPDKVHCNSGDTCAEACGAGFVECPSTAGAFNCFNPGAAQTCCQDADGMSCDSGYYCTHDTKGETWCCPDAMDLAACAAAYTITGGLETPTPTPTSASSTPKPTTPTTTMSTPSATSSGYSTAWSASNGTISSNLPTQPSESAPHTVMPSTTVATVPTTTNAAGANSVSALLLAAAGLVVFL